MLTRRQTLLAATATTLVGIAGSGPVHAADKVIKMEHGKVVYVQP